MGHLKQKISFILLIHLLCAAGKGQDPAKVLERELWRTRADVITSNLLKDASNTDALDRALLLAQLSEAWWRAEPTLANTWIEKSVDAISFYPSEEAKKNNKKLFEVSREVQRLISGLNEKQSNRLLEILSKTPKDISNSDKELNAESLIQEAVVLAKTDPQNATKLGLRALAITFPDNAHDLAWSLRHFNSELANQFFHAALSKVAASPQPSNLHGMQLIAFPESANPDFPVQFRPPRDLRILFLSFVADYLYKRQLAFSSKAIQNCFEEGLIATRLKRFFAELLPHKSEVIEQTIGICLSNLKPEIKPLLTTLETRAQSVDELLKEADREKNHFVRARYLLNAALLTNQQKKFAKSVEILEQMNDEERKVDVDFWEDLRFDSAAGLAAVEFNEGDPARASKTLKDIPDALRPLGQISFVYQFSPDDQTCFQFCIEQLHEGRRGIVKSDLPFMRKANYWFQLTKLYSHYKLQTEAAEAFKEMVLAFNSARSDAKSRDYEADLYFFIIASSNIVPNFSSMLFETKEDSMFESVKLLNDEKARVHMNLQFLKLMIHKYLALKGESENKTSTPD